MLTLDGGRASEFTQFMAKKLSDRINTGYFALHPASLRIRETQITSFEAYVAEQYTALHVDNATVGCFFEPHKHTAFPNLAIKPDIELR